MEGNLLEIVGEDGHRYWFEMLKTEVPLSQESAKLYSFRDYSQIVNANTALRDNELTIAMCSHELKTPLQGLLGMIGMLSMG